MVQKRLPSPAKAPAKKAPAKKAVPTKPVVEAPAKVVAVAPKAEPVKAVTPVVHTNPVKPLPVWNPCEVVATWQDWTDAVTRAAFTGRRLSLPVLAAAVVTTDANGAVVVRSSDLDLFVETRLPSAYMDGPGPMLVRARLLLDALKGIKGSLSASQGNCERISVIRDNKGNTTVSGFGRTLRLSEEAALPAKDFPDWPKVPGVLAARLPSGAFLDGYGFALTAVGKDDTLPFLTGCLMETTDGPFICVSTDRYRVALSEIPAKSVIPFKVLVPRTAFPVVKSLSGRVNMYLDPKAQADGRVLFQSGNVSVSVRLLDATFPTYRALLPSSGTKWVLDRMQLIGDVTAAAATKDRGEPVRVTFDAAKYQVEGCEIHSVEHIGKAPDEGWTTSFNARFLLDGLKALQGDEITVMGNSANKPHLITGKRYDHEATYLIMPTRLPS